MSCASCNRDYVIQVTDLWGAPYAQPGRGGGKRQEDPDRTARQRQGGGFEEKGHRSGIEAVPGNQAFTLPACLPKHELR